MKIKDIANVTGMSISEARLFLMKNESITLDLNEKNRRGM